MNDQARTKELDAIRHAFERISAHGWGMALGVVAALALFLATAILLLKGGPDPGPHLGLLREYFPGYSVTWPGACIGALYALVIGYGAGLTIGTIYNWIVERTPFQSRQRPTLRDR